MSLMHFLVKIISCVPSIILQVYIDISQNILLHCSAGDADSAPASSFKKNGGGQCHDQIHYTCRCKDTAAAYVSQAYAC